MTIHDYSNRRGVLVPLLPKVHALLKEIAERDKLSEAPEHVITWQQKKRLELTDINRRFLVAMDGEILAGIFFYRYADSATKVFLEDVQVAWSYRNNPRVIEGFLKKLEYDAGTKDAAFFTSERIKHDADKEILASKGLATETDNELGSFPQMVAAMKIRYNRG